MNEIEKYLFNFEIEIRNERNTEKSESVFFANDQRFNGRKRVDIAKFCRAQRHENKKHVLSAKIGHILPENCLTYKKFESDAIKKTKKFFEGKSKISFG